MKVGDRIYAKVRFGDDFENMTLVVASLDTFYEDYIIATTVKPTKRSAAISNILYMNISNIYFVGNFVENIL